LKVELSELSVNLRSIVKELTCYGLVDPERRAKVSFIGITLVRGVIWTKY